MIFVSNTIQYNTIQYNTIQYNRFKEGAVTPEQGILLGFPTPEQGDKFKTPVAHTCLIKVESPSPGTGGSLSRFPYTFSKIHHKVFNS